MAMGTPVFLVKPFDGHNFSNWLFRLELLLEQNKVLNVISEEVPKDEKSKTSFMEQDVKARGLIIQHITDNIMSTVKDQRTAKGMMDILKKTYGMSGIGEQVRIKQELSNLKFRGESSLLSFFNKFENLVNDLKSAGGVMNSQEIITTLLSSMPSKYQSVTRTVDILFHQNPDAITLDFLKNQLLSEEVRIQGDSNKVENESSVFVGQKKNKFFKKPKFPVREVADKHQTFKFRCYECNEKGHRKADCPKLKNKAKSHVADNNACFISEDKEALCSSAKLIGLSFVVDSGSTHHLVDSSTGAFLQDVEDVDFDINVAKQGQTLKATRCGKLKVILPNGNPITIEKVIECPNLTRNLLSVRRIEQKGYNVIFSSDNVFIEKSDGTVILEGKINGNLYVVNFGLPNSQATSFKVDSSEDELLLHRRMGHSSTYPCKQPCDVCLKGKQTRNSFHLVSADRKPKRMLEVISSDVCGPFEHETYDGVRYYVTFLDHYSHFTHVYLMKTKDEVFEIFKSYEATVTSHCGFKIDRLRCDNGGEYVSKDFKSFCREKGITLEYTVPRNPQQNGCCERLNRTICDCLRCLLIDSKMSKGFWGEAVRSAVYLINRRPTAALNKGVTPAEVWYGYKPNLSKIKLFGCVAYCHVDKELRKKLDDRSSKMVMVGYANNGYRLWDPQRRKVIVAKHVKFFENDLYFDTQHEHDKEQTEVTIQVVKPEESDPVENGREDPGTAQHQLNLNPDDGPVNIVQELDNEHQDEEQYEENGLRRSRREKKLPSWHNDYEMDFAAAYSVDEILHDGPKSYEEAVQDSGWRNAVQEELNCLDRNKTWELVKTPKNETIIDSRWIFKEKSVNGVTMKKARLVARGFLQGEKSCEEIFAPVARMITIRTLLSFLVVKNFEFCQLDVKSAFLNGELNIPVYMKPPKGVNTEDGVVCKLKKSLYGLKEAPKCWYTRLNDYLITLGFNRSASDPCFYFTDSVFLVIYVDDMIILSKEIKDLLDVKTKLIAVFEMKDLTNDKCLEFLGISIEKSDGGLILKQTKLIEKIIKKFKMEDAKPATLPMLPKLQLTKTNNCPQNLPYKQLLGSLIYLMLGTRPDLCFSVTYFSTFQNCYDSEHWKYLKGVVRYLIGTKDLALVYTQGNETGRPIECFCDSDFANDVEDRKSISGYVFKVFGNTVAWKTKKQPVVALSTCEAEYIALATCATECIFISRLLSEMLSREISPVVIYEDNQSCIKMAKTLETKRSKHIDVRFHYIKELVANKKVKIKYIPTEDQVGDLFTKGLPISKFRKFRSELGIL